MTPRLFVFVCIAFVCFTPVALADTSAPPIDRADTVITSNKAGRVGLGTTEPQATFDVYRGEIKIGSTGAPCVSLRAGTLRYDHGRLQLCDGAVWRNVSLDKAE